MSKTNLKAELRPLVEADVPLIRQVAVESFEQPWSVEDIRYFIVSESGWSRGIFVDGKLVGYFLALKLSGGEMDVVSIAMLPSYRRQGLAKELVRAAMSEPDCSRLILEVRTDNNAAVALYRVLGFTVFGERKKYYEGKWDATCMHYYKK